MPAWPEPAAGYSTRPAGHDAWRIYTEALPLPKGHFRVWMQAAQKLDIVRDTMRAMLRYLLAVFPVLLALSAAAGWVLCGRALRPILEIAATAASIGGNELSRRIGYRGSTAEVIDLAASFDRMLERLESAFARERRFVADAAHELRTPLAALKGQIEVALGKPRAGSDYRRGLQGLRRSVDRLIRLSNDLLLMARVGQGSPPQEQSPISAADLLDAVLDHVAPRMRKKRLSLEVLDREQAVVRGNMDELIRLFLNLLENAAKYAPEGGAVKVELARESSLARIDISNSGAGIPAGDLPRVFEPFYRAQADRSRETGGAGLGLAIAREIALKHGGSIAVRSEPGVITTFTVLLPLSDPPA
jgi:heavy metal sensor kinase